MAYDTHHADDSQTYTGLDFESGADDGVLTSGNSNTYTNCRFRSNTGHGLAVSGSNNTYTNCVVEDNGEGGLIVNEQAQGNRFINCILYNNSGVAPDLSSNVEFVNCVFHSNTAQPAVERGKTLSGSNNLLDTVGIPRTAKPSDLPTLDANHPLYSNWKLYCHVDQASGDLINLADRSLDGTLTNATYTIDDTYGRVLDFDGTGDYVGFGTGFDVSGYSGWSVGLVFRLNSLTGTQILFSKGNGAGTFQWQLLVESDGDILFQRVNTVDGSFLTANRAARIAAGEWYRVVGTFDETGSSEEAKLYVEADAVDTASAPGTGTIQTDATAALQLGERDDGTGDMTGQIKTAFLADAIMTAEQAADWIRDPTSALTPQVPPRTLDPAFDWHDNIVVYSHVSQDTGDLVNLADETTNGTLTNATYTTDSEKGRVVDFDGVDDRVNYGTSFNTSAYSGWSVGMVVCLKDVVGNQLLAATDDDTNSEWRWYVANDGWVNFVRDSTTGNYIQLEHGQLTADTWAAVVLTFDETDGAEEVTIYHSGSSASNSTRSGTKQTTHTAQLSIGEQQGTGTWDINAKIKTFFLADTVLTAAQANAWIANPEAPLRSAPDVPALNPDLAWTGNVQLAVGGTAPRAYVPNVADRGVTDGTMVGNARYVKDADWGDVLDFDGTGDYVNFGSGFSVAGYTSGWSCGCVFKLGDTSGDQLLMGRGAGGNFEWSLRSGGTSMEFIRWSTTGTKYYDVDYIKPLAADTWYVVVGTYDESDDTMKLYIDTDAVQTGTSGSGSRQDSATANFQLGERDDGASDLNGQIAVAFLADTILTAQQAADWIADPHSLFAHRPATSDAHRPAVNMGLPWADDLVMVAGVTDNDATTVRNLVDGSTNGTITGATYTQDATYGEVLDFDGADDEVSFGANFDIAGTNFSFGVVFNVDDLTATYTILGKFAAGAEQWDLSVDITSGDLTFTRYNQAAGAYVSTTSSAKVVADTWYAVVGTYDDAGADMNLYVDSDAVVNSSTTSGTIETTATANFLLGERADGTRDLNGQIAMAWVANTELTAAEAQAWTANPHTLFVDGRKRTTAYTLAAGHALYSNVTRCYALAEGAGTHAEDLAGNSDGTLDSTAGWVTVDGELAVDVTDSGTNADIDGGTSPFGAAAGSVVIRFFAASYAAGDRLLDDGKLQLYSTDTTGDLTFTFDGGTTTVSTSADPGTDQWHTLVLAWASDGTTDGWLDGDQVYTAANPGTPEAATTNLFIGNDAGANNLDGYVAFVAVLDTEASDAQAKSLSLNPYQLLYEHEQGFVNTAVFDTATAIGDIFVDAAGSDYTPADGSSPVVDAGVAVAGRTTDYNGITVPSGAGPDIGAVERASLVGGRGHHISLALRLP